jgi:hypothetical protein
MEIFILWVFTLIISFNLGYRFKRKRLPKPKHPHSPIDGPFTPKPEITPKGLKKPEFPPPRLIREDFL